MSTAVLKVFVLLFLFQPEDGPAKALAQPIATSEQCEAAALRLSKAGLPEGVVGAIIKCVEIDLPQNPSTKPPV